MAGFVKSVVTDVGRSALMRVLTDQSSLNFVRIALGDGQMDPLLTPDQLAVEEVRQTALISERASINVTENKLSSPKVATIGGVLNNVELATGFALAEIGLYVSDGEGGETLYAYANAQDGTRWIPGYNGSVAYQELIRVNCYIGDAQSVTFTAPSDAYVTVGTYDQLESTFEETKANLTAQVEALTAALKKLQRCHIDDLKVELEITNQGTAKGSVFQPGDTVHVEGLVSNPTPYPAKDIHISIVTGSGVLCGHTSISSIDSEGVEEIGATHVCTEEDVRDGLSFRAVVEVRSDVASADIVDYTEPVVIKISETSHGPYRAGDTITGTIDISNHSNQTLTDLILTVLPETAEVFA